MGTGITFMVGGVVFLLSGVFIFLHESPLGWEKTEGQLLTAAVGSHAGVRGMQHWVDVTFSYTVSGRSYTGSNYLNSTLVWGFETPALLRVRRLQETQALQGHVMVYYRPDHPGIGTLTLAGGFVGLHFSSAGLGCFFLGLGIVLRAAAGGSRTPARLLRSATLSWGLAGGSAVGMLLAVFTEMFVPFDYWLNPWAFLTWAVGLASCAFIATRRPSYQHLAEMEERFSRQAPVKKPVKLAYSRKDRRLGLVFATFPLGFYLLFSTFVWDDDQMRLGALLCAFLMGSIMAMPFYFVGRDISASRGQGHTFLAGAGTAFEHFARRTHGVLKAGRRWSRGLPSYFVFRAVAFSHEGIQADLASMRVKTQRQRQGEWHCLTRLCFALPRSVTLSLSVSPQNTTLGIGPALGFQDIELGSALFDDQFLVKASDERAACEVLTPAVQEELLGLLHLTRDPSDARVVSDHLVRLHLAPGELRVEIAALFGTEEGLLLLYASGTRILGEVRRVLRV
jgi:hypothetical protein